MRTPATLGCDTPEGFLGEHPYYGATVGRVANRIAGGTFQLSGQTYAVPQNDPGRPNSLHGGDEGWSRKQRPPPQLPQDTFAAGYGRRKPL